MLLSNLSGVFQTLTQDILICDLQVRPPPGSVVATGFFKNYNTIEEFKTEDKTAIFNREADKVSHCPSFVEEYCQQTP
jgi:hypothetical protein